MEPDFSTSEFRGKEKITAEAGKPTDTIILNAVGMAIEAFVIDGNGKAEAKIIEDLEKEEIALKLPRKISGKCVIEITFSGKLKDNMDGFYRSRYNHKGREKYIATTHFEPAGARHAFPCWDEPSAKATFDISVLADKGMQAISNMPLSETKRAGKKVLFKFEKTPPMSTYLVYVGVGEFEFAEEMMGGTKIRVATTPGKIKNGRFALEYAKKALSFFQEYLEIAYPLPKLDLIAVPDFAFGAMENWGAIVFRETALLFDQKTSSAYTKQRIAEIIAHEIAHQWFGDLVTMQWWDDLWLNESFATFTTMKAVSSMHPEWRLCDQFITESMNEAFELDALKTSHPIEVKINSPREAEEIFDDISYDKGACIIRMFEDFIGESKLRSSLKHYLNEHKYGNATTAQLWKAIARECNQPIDKAMDTWTKQVGYPVIEVSARKSKLVLKQSRFLLDGGRGKGLWNIPISIKTPDETHRELMTKKAVSVESKGEWFKLNAGQKCLYRVKYASSDLKNLKRVMPILENTDRWGIQNDLFALCRAGKAQLREYLELVSSYEEKDFLVLADVTNNLYVAYLLAGNSGSANEIKKCMEKYCSRIFDRLGWEPKEKEPHTDTLMRGSVVSVLGKLNNEYILKVAKEKFEAFLENHSSLHPDIRMPVYSLTAWQGDEKTFDTLVKCYGKAETQEEKTRLLAALGGFQNKDILKKALKFSTSGKVRLQDMAVPILRVASNPCGKDLIWPWIKQNWRMLRKTFQTGGPQVNRILECLSVISDANTGREVGTFLKKNAIPGTEMKVNQVLEKIRINAKFVGRVRKEFGQNGD